MRMETTLWCESSDEAKQELIDAIKKCDKDAVRDWIITHDKLDYGDMSIRRLREEATKKGVKNVTRKLKQELIAELENVKKQERINERDSKIIGSNESST